MNQIKMFLHVVLVLVCDVMPSSPQHHLWDQHYVLVSQAFCLDFYFYYFSQYYYYCCCKCCYSYYYLWWFFCLQLQPPNYTWLTQSCINFIVLFLHWNVSMNQFFSVNLSVTRTVFLHKKHLLFCIKILNVINYFTAFQVLVYTTSYKGTLLMPFIIKNTKPLIHFLLYFHSYTEYTYKPKIVFN